MHNGDLVNNLTGQAFQDLKTEVLEYEIVVQVVSRLILFY